MIFLLACAFENVGVTLQLQHVPADCSSFFITVSQRVLDGINSYLISDFLIKYSYRLLIDLSS